MFVYLDNSATTRPLPEVSRTMITVMEENYGNPSSLHRMGIEAEKILKNARKQVSRNINCDPDNIFFTSGGTESNNTAILGVAESLKRRGNHIITTPVEHPAVLECCRKLERIGYQVTYLGVDDKGMLDEEELKNAITDQTILVSVMHVNNELGTIQPIEKIGKMVKAFPKIVFHCDAVQSYGKLSMSVDRMNVDLLSASAHKIKGPKGSGLLYVRKGTRIEPHEYGGGQERGFRSGTENTPAIAGFGVAAELAFQNQMDNLNYVTRLRDYLLKGLQTELTDIRINSPVDGPCLPYVLNVSFLGTRGEVLLHSLETKNIYVSTGSACSSKKAGSHVLTACGLSDAEIQSAIRFSFSPDNTLQEMDYTIEQVKKAVKDIRRMLKLAGK